jgi:hypothetical protein
LDSVRACKGICKKMLGKDFLGEIVGGMVICLL